MDAFSNIKYPARFAFETMEEMVETARAAKHHPSAGTSSTTVRGDGEWYATTDLDDACNKAIYGWPAATRKMLALRERLNDDAVELMNLAEQIDFDEYDVSGDVCDIGLYADGDPECMVTQVERTERPFNVYIYANNCQNAGVNADRVMRRGAATLALVDILETAGVRCEVIVCSKTGGLRWGNDPAWGHLIAAIAKRLNDTLDVDRLAFALCNPSFDRRLVFKLQESCGATSAYGRAMSLTAADLIDTNQALCIDTSTNATNAPQWATDESAIAWVREQVKRFLPGL